MCRDAGGDRNGFHHVQAPLWPAIELSPALERRIRARMKKRLLAIRLETWQIARAKEIARKKGVPYQQLMREWISRGIRAEGRPSRTAHKRKSVHG